MFRIETVFELLLTAVHEQTEAIELAVGQDPSRLRALGACLRTTLAHLDRIAVLIVVQASAGDAHRARLIAADLDAIHRRVKRALALGGPDAEAAEGAAISVRRFATRLSALDPLAPFRSGPRRLVDVSDKLITGVSLHDAAQYSAEILGASEVTVAGAMLQDADLAMARLSMAQLLDLDARTANLDGAIAIAARLWRVNLAGASMRDANLQGVLARDCDFSVANLANVRWHHGTAIRCSFARATLTDLSAGRAVFLHCDFRGADLTTGELGAWVTMTGARFQHCDLRWSRWDHRTLAGVSFVGCKLHGVRGAPHVDGVIIDEPDLSPAGDLSQPGTLADVLALWAMPAGSGWSAGTICEEAS